MFYQHFVSQFIHNHNIQYFIMFFINLFEQKCGFFACIFKMPVFCDIQSIKTNKNKMFYVFLAPFLLYLLSESLKKH